MKSSSSMSESSRRCIIGGNMEASHRRVAAPVDNMEESHRRGAAPVVNKKVTEFSQGSTHTYTHWRTTHRDFFWHRTFVTLFSCSKLNKLSWLQCL
jgi:hypothetical protein